jgi:hypothetical protein
MVVVCAKAGEDNIAPHSRDHEMRWILMALTWPLR